MKPAKPFPRPLLNDNSLRQWDLDATLVPEIIATAQSLDWKDPSALIVYANAEETALVMDIDRIVRLMIPEHFLEKPFWYGFWANVREDIRRLRDVNPPATKLLRSCSGGFTLQHIVLRIQPQCGKSNRSSRLRRGTFAAITRLGFPTR